MLKSVFLCGVSALTSCIVSTASAEICDSYVVTSGDTLRIIAERYYGDRHLSSEIYDVNQGIIGANPNAVEIGTTLAIPCRDGMAAVQQSAFLATIDQPHAAPGNIPSGYFVAIAGENPFINAQGAGIFPELLAVALRTGGFEERLEIIRSPSSDEVLAETSAQSALLSFPWIKPDCSAASRLSENAQNLCRSYTFSDPVYEITLGLFTRAGDPLADAEASEDLSGKNVCIPGFHSDEILRRDAVLNEDISIIRAASFSACRVGLADGSYDAIVADYQSYNLFAADDPAVVDIPAFATNTTLHAVASIENPEAVKLITIANAGIREMLVTGTWFSIVEAHTTSRVH